MAESIFFETGFILLVICSLVLPIALYAYMMRKRAISRKTVLSLGVLLIVLSGADIFLLQQLKAFAQASSSLLDDLFFISEISVALYLLPALFAGVGINMISHVLIRHLSEAERRFERDHPERRRGNPE